MQPNNMVNLISAIQNAVTEVNNKPEYKSIFITSQSASFTAGDGSSSALIHIYFECPETGDKDKDQAIYDNWSGLQPDLKKEIIRVINEVFIYALTIYNYKEGFISQVEPDDFTTLIRAWAFKDQPTFWASITGTDECLIITIRHYPQ